MKARAQLSEETKGPTQEAGPQEEGNGGGEQPAARWGFLLLHQTQLSTSLLLHKHCAVAVPTAAGGYDDF